MKPAGSYEDVEQKRQNAIPANEPTTSDSQSPFRLPVVHGRMTSMSNAAFERACLVHIERLQHGIGPYDSAMMSTFCEAVRLVREYTDAMQGKPAAPIDGEECASACRQVEVWECRTCDDRTPCRIEITFSDAKLPEHLKGNQRFRHMVCPCNERQPLWDRMP